jgi:hypothetical protein
MRAWAPGSSGIHERIAIHPLSAAAASGRAFPSAAASGRAFPSAACFKAFMSIFSFEALL